MLLDAFSKVQSSRTPHEVVLEQFKLFLDRKLQTEIERTTWLEELDLMNPFTNHLPQRNLITMNIVSLVNKVGRSKWFIAIMTVSFILFFFDFSQVHRLRSGSLTTLNDSETARLRTPLS